jgi:MoaA/NifB/PqqE/SkfB family radical SAM enzyme
MQNDISLKHFAKLPSYFIRGIKYHSAGYLYTPKPLLSTISLTSRCNSKCIMCLYWRETENKKLLSPEEIAEIYKNPLFDSIETLALSGGEPTLREEIVEIVQRVLDVRPRVQEIILCTNGLDPDRVVEKTRSLLELANSRGISKFAVSTSIDGYGSMHEQIRRVPRAFERVSETIRRLQELQKESPFFLSATCVVQPLNIDNLVKTAEFCKQIALPLTFVPVCTSNTHVDDEATRDNLQMTRIQTNKLKSIFSNELSSYITASNRPFWKEYFQIVAGKRRILPCFMADHYVLLDSDGTLLTCGADNSLVYGNVKDEPADALWLGDKGRALRRKLKTVYCPGCTVHCNLVFSLTHEFFYFAGYYFNEKRRKLFRQESRW